MNGSITSHWSAALSGLFSSKNSINALSASRLNIVATAFVKETMAMMGMDTSDGLSAADTAKAYVSAVTGDMKGQTLDVGDFV